MFPATFFQSHNASENVALATAKHVLSVLQQVGLLNPGLPAQIYWSTNEQGIGPVGAEYVTTDQIDPATVVLGGEYYLLIGQQSPGAAQPDFWGCSTLWSLMSSGNLYALT